MQASRRQAVLVGASALLLPGAAPAPPRAGPAGLMRIFHVRGTPDGRSQLVEVHVAPASKPLPIVSVVARSMKAGVEDWHNAPFKTFTINTAGRIRTTMSDGSTQHIGPGDLVYLEDVAGRGHLTHLLTDVAALFLRVADDFDLAAWAAS